MNPRVSKIKSTVKQEISCGVVGEALKLKIKTNFSDEGLSDVSIDDIVKDAIAEYGGYDLIRQVIEGKLLAPHNDKGWLIYNHETKSKTKIKPDNLRNVIHPSKFGLNSRLTPCVLTYDPRERNALFSKGAETMFNQYVPADWFSAYFYDEKLAVPVITEMPLIYREFLTHLVAGAEESFEYIVRWLAHSLRDRNFCYLVTIGDEGIGKGILGEIIKLLHGEDNYSYSIFSEAKKFNALFMNKTIIYLDEVSVKTAAQENQLKSLTNNTMEHEKKGVDAENNPNFASIYLSSNDRSSIKIEDGSRRYSIVDLTDIKIASIWSGGKIGELLLPENIASLGKFLWHYKYDVDSMTKPLKTKRTEEVAEESMHEAEDYIINQFCIKNAGKTVKLVEAQNELASEINAKARMTAKQFRDLGKKVGVGKVYTVKRIQVEDGKYWFLAINKLDDQPRTT